MARTWAPLRDLRFKPLPEISVGADTWELRKRGLGSGVGGLGDATAKGRTPARACGTARLVILGVVFATVSTAGTSFAATTGGGTDHRNAARRGETSITDYSSRRVVMPSGM